MKKKINLLAILICLWMSTQPSLAQERIEHKTTKATDVQARTGFSLEKTIAKKLHLKWSEELRTKNSASEIDRIYSSIAASYDVLSWLTAEIDYTFIAVKNKPSGWEFRNRANIDIIAHYRPTPQWELSLRERFRITSINRNTDPLIEANPAWIMRSRLMAEYQIHNIPLQPYAYVELSNTLNTPRLLDNFIDKIRFSIGIKYKPAPRSEIDLFYRLDHNISKDISYATRSASWVITTNMQYNHIIGVFYQYSF